MFCSQCGKTLTEGTAFCQFCGALQETDADVTPQPMQVETTQVEHDDPQARFDRARQCQQNGEFAEAEAIYTELAELGYSGPKTNLGNMYFFGRGVPMDRARGLYWLDQAAAQGEAGVQEFVRDWRSPDNPEAREYHKWRFKRLRMSNEAWTIFTVALMVVITVFIIHSRDWAELPPDPGFFAYIGNGLWQYLDGGVTRVMEDWHFNRFFARIVIGVVVSTLFASWPIIWNLTRIRSFEVSQAGYTHETNHFSYNALQVILCIAVGPIITVGRVIYLIILAAVYVPKTEKLRVLLGYSKEEQEAYDEADQKAIEAWEEAREKAQEEADKEMPKFRRW
jgi:hypothetical protein